MDWKALTYIKSTKNKYWWFFVVMLVINKAHELMAPGNTLFPFGLKTMVPGDELALFLRIRG